MLVVCFYLSMRTKLINRYCRDRFRVRVDAKQIKLECEYINDPQKSLCNYKCHSY